MNKKVLLIVILISVILGGGYAVLNKAGKTTFTGDLEITHQLGKTFVKHNPERVVVFDMGILDSLDALGIEVIGVPKDSLPDYLSKYSGDKYASVGSMKEPDFEKLNALKPDLIIISGRQAEYYDALSKIAPTIYLGIDNTRYLASFKENMNILTQIFAQEEKIQEHLNAIEAKIAELKGYATEHELTGLIVLLNGSSLSAYGPNSRFGIIHDEFGITAINPNIEASTHGQNIINYEFFALNRAKYLFVIDRGSVVSSVGTASPIYDIVKPNYTPDQIIFLDPQIWYLSGGGLTSTYLMVEEILNALK